MSQKKKKKTKYRKNRPGSKKKKSGNKKKVEKKTFLKKLFRTPATAFLVFFILAMVILAVFLVFKEEEPEVEVVTKPKAVQKSIVLPVKPKVLAMPQRPIQPTAEFDPASINMQEVYEKMGAPKTIAETKKFLLSQLTSAVISHLYRTVFLYRGEEFACIGTQLVDEPDGRIITSAHLLSKKLDSKKLYYHVANPMETQRHPIGDYYYTNPTPNKLDGMFLFPGPARVIETFLDFKISRPDMQGRGTIDPFSKEKEVWLTCLLDGKRYRAVGQIRESGSNGTRYVIVHYAAIPGNSGTGFIDDENNLIILAGAMPMDQDVLDKFPVVVEHFTELSAGIVYYRAENVQRRIPEEKRLENYEQEKRSRAFYAEHMQKLIEDEIMPGNWQIPEVNSRIKELHRLIEDRFEKKLDFRLNPFYHPLAKDILAGATIFNGQPIIELYVPCWKDEYEMFQADERIDAKLWFETTAVGALVHEMDHLAYEGHLDMQDISEEKLIECEKKAHAKTCEYLLTHLVKHRMPLEKVDKDNYEVWIMSGRDVNSPVWEARIRHLYANRR